MENKTILLVEDNPDDEALILHSLERNNFMNRVVVVHDGAEALDYLFGAGLYAERNVSITPQVILLDLKLPKIDGLEVLYRVRTDERTALLPVVVLTSSDEERDIVESYKRGANSYVRKPIDFSQFSETIRQLGVYWLILNQAPTHKQKNVRVDIE